MITELQRKTLRHFFAAYFHQDWRREADTPEQVISMYATDVNDLGTIDTLVDGISAFIADHPDEDRLANALFREMGCYHSPKALGQSTREWLLHVAKTVKAERPRVEQRAAEKRAVEDLDEGGEF
ncbi:MAG TPA: contact-dependent growth inhibition system immunity protein [Kofleriaceae bacterium]